MLSIDDLYLPREMQKALAESHPDNPLVQHRGEPSTHDVELGKALFQDLAKRKRNIKVPSYDKSAYNGAGDQLPESKWRTINEEGSKPTEVIVFEGWCVGFRALGDAEVEEKWRAAKEDFDKNGDHYKGQLGKQKLESVLFVNDNLRKYDALTDQFGAFVHMYVNFALLLSCILLMKGTATQKTPYTYMTGDSSLSVPCGNRKEAV